MGNEEEAKRSHLENPFNRMMFYFYGIIISSFLFGVIVMIPSAYTISGAYQLILIVLLVLIILIIFYHCINNYVKLKKELFSVKVSWKKD